jgi:LuxR family maltose regulon positive regulatory protein
LHAEFDRPLIYVLDDLHWIQGKPELEEAISLLIQRAPPNVHFVIGSRTWPNLSCLPKLVADDEVAQLDANDLRFSPEEAVQLLDRFWDQPVTPEDGQEINDRTGGWVAAIMLTTKNPISPTLLTSDRLENEDMLFNYLTAEVFDRLPDSLQSFLLQTSILREFSEECCLRLLGRSDSAAQIAQIKDRGLLLEERSSRDATFAYHDLFRQYLQSRFQSVCPEESQSLHRRAAALYEEMADDDAAIYHYLQGDDTDQALKMVKKVADSFFIQGRWQKLSSWLSGLPQDAVEDDPDLLLLLGQVQLRLGNPTESLTELDKLVKGAHSQIPEVLGRALVAKSTAYRRLRELDQAISTAKEAIAILLGTQCRQEHLAEAYRQVGDAFVEQSDYKQFQEYLEKALSLSCRENLLQYSLINNDLGVVFMESGQMEQATFYLEQARIGLQKLGSPAQLAQALVNLALVFYHRG